MKEQVVSDDIQKSMDENVYCDKNDRMVRNLDSILEEIFEEDFRLSSAMDECENKLKEVYDTIEITEKQADPNGIFFTPQASKRTKFSNTLGEEVSKLTNEMNQYKLKKEKLNIKKNNIFEIVSYLKERGNIYTDSNQILSNPSVSELLTSEHIKMLEIQENERNRISRDIHDSTVQNLTSLVHRAELCMKMVDRDPIETKLELQTMIGTIRSAIDELRMIIYNLRPMSIDDLGLVVTVERYIQNLMLKNDLKINLEIVNSELDVLPIINLTLYRLIQEACNNAVKHAQANNIYIKISYFDNMIEVVIEDDGIGIKTAKNDNLNRSDLSGFGLSIMKERVFLLSGNISFKERDEGGTKVVFTVPI